MYGKDHAGSGERIAVPDIEKGRKKMTLYTKEQILILRENACKIALSMPEDFLSADPEKLSRICNGIGPERWKRKYRILATFIWRNFQEAAMIHDYRYSLSDGKKASRQKYDQEFYNNCLLLLHHKYPRWKIWTLPAKMYAYVKILLAEKLLKIFGACAYLYAYEKRKEKIEDDSFQ